MNVLPEFKADPNERYSVGVSAEMQGKEEVFAYCVMDHNGVVVYAGEIRNEFKGWDKSPAREYVIQLHEIFKTTVLVEDTSFGLIPKLQNIKTPL